MKQITVLNPNITTVEQNRLGLSHFGMLSRLFTLELATRVHQEEGMWQALPLELLEDGEKEEQQPPVPEIQLNLDLKIFTKALREELARQQEHGQEKKETEKKPAVLTVEQRVLERILLRERELWKVNSSRTLPRSVPGLRMPTGGADAVTLLSGERYVILKEQREMPRQTAKAVPSQNQRTDREEIFLIGQPPQALPASYEPMFSVASAVEKARLANRFGVGAAGGYRAARSRFPFSDVLSWQVSSEKSVGIAPLFYREGASLSSESGTGDAAGSAFGHNAAPHQYALLADLFYPDSELSENRTEASDSGVPARRTQSPRQNETISAGTAQNEIRELQRRISEVEADGNHTQGSPARNRVQRSAAAEADAVAAPWNQTPALHRQQNTLAQTISTLAQLQAQKELRQTQVDTQRPQSRAGAEVTAAFPSTVENIPKAWPNLTLTSQITTTPAGDGWAPQWQSEHPGYSHKTPDQEKALGGSILFPDLLRYRREQAISGDTTREENRVPAALSAVLRDAADRERSTRTVNGELPGGQHVQEQADRREALQDNTQRNATQQQEKQQTEQQFTLQSAPADSHSYSEGRNEAAQQHIAETSAESEQTQTTQAVPVTGSAAQTISPVSAELEYKTQEQADRQLEQPAGQKPEQKNALLNTPADSPHDTESRAKAVQQHAAEALAEKEQVQTPRQTNNDDTSEETEQEHSAQAVPVTDSATPTISFVSDELEYKAQEQAGWQTEQQAGKQAQRQYAAEKTEKTEQAQAVPVTGSAAPSISPVSAELEYKTQEQADWQLEQPAGQKSEQKNALLNTPADSPHDTESRAKAVQQHAAEALAEKEQAQTPRQTNNDDTSEETEQEHSAQAVPVTDSATPTISSVSAELEYRVQEQSDRQSEQPTGKQIQAAQQPNYAVSTEETEQTQTAQAVPVADSAAQALSSAAAELEYKAQDEADRQSVQPAQQPNYAVSSKETEQTQTAHAVSVTDSATPTISSVSAELEYRAQEQSDWQMEQPTGKQLQAAQQPNYSVSSEETEQTAQAVPVTGSAAQTLSSVPAELEYKRQEQSDQQTEQPTEHRVERQNALSNAPAVSRSDTENRNTAARRQHAVETTEETEQAQPARAVPVADSAAQTFPSVSAELEYKAQEQADRQPEQPAGQSTGQRAEQTSVSPKEPRNPQSVTKNKTTVTRQQHVTEAQVDEEQAQTPMGMPVADSDKTHGITPVVKTLAHRDTLPDVFDSQNLADSVSSRHSPLANAARQPSRESTTGRMDESKHTILTPIPDQQNPAPWDTGVELTYTQPLRTPQDAATGDSSESSAEHHAKSAFSQELPSWARAVLQQNGGQLPPPGAQTNPFGGGKSGTTGGSINWSAPYALPFGMQSSEQGKTSYDAGPSPMVFHNINETEQEQTPGGREYDERTARKMADKVYKIIEERLRKELRRGGK